MLKITKNLIIVFFLVAAVFLVADFALAEVDVGISYGQNIGLGGEDPRTMAVNIIRIALGFLGIIAVGLIIYGGWIYMSSAGNEEKISKAKKILIGAAIGLVIILSSFAIVSFILNKLSESTYGQPCSPVGATQSCGSCLCGVISYGARTCQASGYWGSCSGLICDSCGPPVPVSCDGNTMEPGCQADDSICGDDQYCDTGTCTCRQSGGYGDPCDGDTSTAECEANDNLCASYLHCDVSAGCICLGNPVIESVSPMGGFCDGSINSSCQNNDDCSAFATSTCNIVTPNGAVGNLVTIRGRYFQEYEPGTSTISFWDGTGFIEAQLASSANPSCDNSWADGQVVVVVPSGASQGPIKISADNGADKTNDAIGPLIDDFLVNTISRPGLCKLNPSYGVMNDTIIYQGIKLSSNDIVNFGDYVNYVEGLNFSYSSVLTVQADVPNIETGTTTSFVKDSNNIISNYLDFGKNAEPYSGPYITSFEPTQGAIGQYVTIYGAGFKNTQGTSHIYFGDANGVKASYKFPDVCADSFWSNSQVVIKVPDGMADGNYTLTMTIDSWITDTSSTTPNSFRVDSSLTLTPGLCKIQPIMGQNNDLISLWGEYFEAFDNTNSQVRFYLNKDQSGTNIGFWNLDPDVATGIKPYKATTTVHQSAITGPVKIVKSSPEVVGNGINFTIGSCTKDENCGTGNVCCPTGVFKGRCKANIDECYEIITSSVYEWDFSTGSSTPTSTPESCLGWALQTGYCKESELCPNSPGQCSKGLITSAGTCGDDYCNNAYSKCDDKCKFGNNKCKADSAPLITECSIYEGDSFMVGGVPVYLPTGYVSSSCRQVGADYYWQINPGLVSCPNDNWEMNIHGWCTLVDSSTSPSTPQTCDVCDSGFSCEKEGAVDNLGKCYIGGEVCAVGSACEDNVCEYDTPINQCECCCRIGQDAQDCCVPLNCIGDCGADAIVVAGGDPDPNDYGYCSGCRVVDAAGNVDQNASDLACNCTGNTGKFCDVNVGDDNDGDGYPDGICRDCNQLSTLGLCSFHHATCCIDAVENDICRGGEGYDIGDYDDLNYCAYYRCDDDLANGCYGDPSSGYTKIASSTGAVFTATSTCAAKCIPGPVYPIGAECKKTLDPPMCQTGLDSCGDYLDCLDKLGSDCRCCCDPNDDGCGNIDTGDATTELKCQVNIEPCTTAASERGLCCGCSQDSHCGNIDTTGCGSDTCCRTRPDIETIVPINGDSSICRNAEISAVFDQKMDISSLTGNVIVVGDYIDEECPAGTVYLALGNEKYKKKNFFVKIYNKFVRIFKNKFISIFKGENAFAELSDPDHNYCAITGTASGEHMADKKTKLIFSVNKLMDAGRDFYVIIKGDKNLNSSNGVLSYWDVGMNATSSPISNTSVFNGLTFAHSYIWKFTTYSEDFDSVFCQINKVKIDPNPYLFQTTANAFNENDTDPNNSTFDTVKDSDKVFTAKALASENAGRQVVVPVDERQWDWEWSIDNKNIVATTSVYMSPASVPFDSASSSQLIIAQSGITDGKTFIEATANVSAGNSKTGTSTVRVFICENPWPPVEEDGTWEPWQDIANNCTSGLEGDSCYNYNYELYYCRDSGGFGTADDLPAILSEDTIIRGADLDSSILKEAYFFREELPDISGISLATTTHSSLAQGNRVALIWNEIILGAGETLDKYSIYYGMGSGSYSYSTSTFEAHSPTAPFIIDNLINDITYYFVVTAKYTSGAESGYSNEVFDIPKDTTASLKPDIILASPGDKKVDIVWEDKSGGDAVSFRIYYKAKSGACDADATIKFGASLSAMSSATAISTTTVSGLMNGVEYCFGIISYDVYGNESEIDYKSAIPFTSASGLSVVKIGDEEIKLSWDEAEGANSYNIYYGINIGNYGEPIAVTASPKTINSLTNNTIYYFAVKSVNADNVVSIDYSNEVSAMPFSFPSNLIATAGDGQVELTWDCGGAGVDQYNIYYGLTTGEYTKDISTSTPGTLDNPQIIGSLINNTTYYFIVKSVSVDANKTESDSTDEVNAIPMP